MTISALRSKFLIVLLSISVLSACGMEPLTSSSAERDLPSARALEYNDEIMNGKLAPPKGFVQQSLFSQQISGNDARFERLETAVQSLHDTLKSHLPAIEKLSAIESDIQELVGQLQTLVSAPMTEAASPLDVYQEDLAEAPAPQPAPAVSAPAPEAPPTPITPPAPTPAPAAPAAASAPSSGLSVNAVRVAQSPDKTRVVLDSARKIDYTLDYDEQENLILITAKNADVAASLTTAASKSNKIMSITSAKEGAHTNLIFVLQGSASVSSGVSLSPNSDNSQHRYYFDIF